MEVCGKKKEIPVARNCDVAVQGRAVRFGRGNCFSQNGGRYVTG